MGSQDTKHVVREIYKFLCDGLNCVFSKFVEVLTPSISESDCAWRHGP